MNRLLILICLYFLCLNLIGQDIASDSVVLFKNKCIGYGAKDSLGKEGIWVYYFKDKLIKTENYSKGILNGQAVIFYPNGSIKSVMEYKNNKLNGEFNFYSTSGTLLAKFEFINDVLSFVKYYIIHPESPPNKHHNYPDTGYR